MISGREQSIKNPNKNMMPKKIHLSILLLLLLSPIISVYAETAYVDDRLRVGVRKEPGNRVAPHAIIETGTALEILEEKDDHIRIKTQDGVEGWIRKIYSTSERPARDRIQELIIAHKKLQEEYDDLKAQTKNQSESESDKVFKALQKKNRELQKEIDLLKKNSSISGEDMNLKDEIQTLKNKNASLEAQLEELTSSPIQGGDISHKTSSNVFTLIVTGLIMLIAGFAAGFIWFRQQMIRKLEGANN